MLGGIWTRGDASTGLTSTLAAVPGGLVRSHVDFDGKLALSVASAGVRGVQILGGYGEVAAVIGLLEPVFSAEPALDDADATAAYVRPRTLGARLVLIGGGRALSLLLDICTRN